MFTISEILDSAPCGCVTAIKSSAAVQASLILFLLFALPITGAVVTGGMKFAPLYLLPLALAYTCRWQCRLAAACSSFIETWKTATNLD